ncbi:hypothetical protein [Bradyrhizobium sp. 139]|uniref:hypothetical protein n=1 Tax=Bradyrhizobium sp. 139 TaxID=2782616 RepID=UPI001FFB5593
MREQQSSPASMSLREHSTAANRTRNSLMRLSRDSTGTGGCRQACFDATTELFEVGGASLISEKLAIDRHWRNARTIASHKPVDFKLRAIGGYELNDEALPYAWSAGIRATRQYSS